MAAFEGIVGLGIGDGEGGKIGLSIQEKVLQILSDRQLSFRYASIMNRAQIAAGTVEFRTPELVRTKKYAGGTGTVSNINAGAVKINIDQQRWVKYSYTMMDIARIETAEELESWIAAGMAVSIENSLNAEFLDYLTKLFKPGGALANANQTVKLTNLPFRPADVGDPTPNQMFNDFMKIEYALIEISTLFDHKHAAVPKNEIITFVSPMVDVNMGLAFRNQPNMLGEWQIEGTLVGKQIKNVKYIVDNQLQKKFEAEQSFSDDEFDFTGFAGFMVHNEAVGFPVNFIETDVVKNPENLDRIVICRYQFGIGAIRPQLIWALTYDQPQANAK